MTNPTYTLHHHPLDPRSRRVRLAMAEKLLICQLVTEKPWEPRPDYLALNPGGDVPTLIIEQAETRVIVADAGAICEYLEETIEPQPLLAGTAVERAEIRRLVAWFETRLAQDVTNLIVGEKVIKRLSGSGQPDSLLIRQACSAIHKHLDYIGWLAERRNWLAGDSLSLADLTAAAQLSVLDYLGDMPWDRHPEVKTWYVRIKSRPSFRSLLGDHIAGLLPPRHYADLDF